MAILPDEIIGEEILLRLPTKILVRFLSVCKRWFSQILDPDFAQSHITHNPNPNHDDDYLILNNLTSSHRDKRSVNDPNYYISTISHNNLSEARINKVPFRVRTEKINLLGSVNGLVGIACVSKHYYYFILWNPAISHFKKILPQKHFLKTLKPYDQPLFAFGWDSVKNDYKFIVKLPHSSLPCAVYSSQTDSWTEIVVSKDYLQKMDLSFKKAPSTIVKGCPYWSGWSWSEVRQSILKFEVESNDFRLIQISNNARAPNYSIFNSNDCLARVQHRGEHGIEFCVDVYHFNEEHNVWSTVYSIDFQAWYSPSMCFKYGGEIVFKQKNCLYDHKSDQIKNIACDEEGYFVNGFSYTPSVVSVKGMKALKEQRPRR